VSGALTVSLADPGPVQLVARELETRLKQIFPEKYFVFAWMPAKADRTWFDRYIKRTPAIALGWDGIAPSMDNGRVFAGSMVFSLTCITKNAHSIQGRYYGDALSPGLLAMVRVAAVALQGWVVDPPDNPFCAQGAVQVAAVENIVPEEWVTDDTAVAALKLVIPYEENLPPGMEMDPAGPLELKVGWDFGDDITVNEIIGPIT
jgi:hypothetical protein